MFTDDLSDYKSYPPTQSCYLDPRYFDLVFQNYPGLLATMNIQIRHSRARNQVHKAARIHVNMNESRINPDYPGLLRISIDINGNKHSNLLILDTNNNRAYRFDPYGTTAPHYREINAAIEQYLGFFVDVDIQDVDVPLIRPDDASNPACNRSGYCVAYVIMYAYAWLNDVPFEPEHVRRFASRVERTYPRPENPPEIECGLFDDNPNPIGTVGGATVGGLLGAGLGPVGLIGGALVGGAVGSRL